MAMTLTPPSASVDQNSPFTISGSYSVNQPPLTYATGGEAAKPIPASATPATVHFQLDHPGIAASGVTNVTVAFPGTATSATVPVTVAAPVVPPGHVTGVKIT